MQDNANITYVFLVGSTYPLHTDTGMKMNLSDILALVDRNYEGLATTL